MSYHPIKGVIPAPQQRWEAFVHFDLKPENSETFSLSLPTFINEYLLKIVLVFLGEDRLTHALTPVCKVKKSTLLELANF